MMVANTMEGFLRLTKSLMKPILRRQEKCLLPKKGLKGMGGKILISLTIALYFDDITTTYDAFT